ncbi:right-handed parallel beta-helix repeat-containing protein [Frankia sp. Cr2]|uniref:right-handed parallel beta-helix repeat-containing protein n=1 Tax=Frankia sp. Cr2 TaxID=3073932 RepID=UPI002AD3CAEF|nr:right-handed parallel beta-helix repeat-containing protein [Frankia sp. Cr2]
MRAFGALVGVLLAIVPGLMVIPGIVGTATAAALPPLPPVTSADAKKQANLVDAEDIRLRATFAKFGVLKAPAIVQNQGTLSTLLLPGRPAPYTVDEVVAAGGMRKDVDGALLVLINIVVGPNARLIIDSKYGTLRLASSAAGFAALTSWRGAIEINGGSAQQQMNVTSWDVKELKPDLNAVDGRAYIRTMGGELVVRNARVSNLGFWNGRSGGLAWTGSKGQPSTGGAANSTFINNVWGAYISGSEGVQMINVRLEGNDRAGLAVHRDAVSTLISGSTATANHGDGITIDRASGSRVMRSTISGNSGDGITLDGRGIGIVATATGVQVNQIKGTVIEGNTLTDNGRYGIRVLGGEDAAVRNNTVSGSTVGIVVKSGANGTQIVDNTVSGVTDAAVQVGPDAKRTAITTNKLSDGRMGIITQDAPTNVISRNTISGSTEFAITIRGQADGTTIGNNTLSGRGWRAVDINKATGITAAALTGNDVSKWIPRVERPWYSIFERHPALFVWTFMALLPILGWRTGRRWRKRAAEHPYPESDLLVQRMTTGTGPKAVVAKAAAAKPGAAKGAPEPVKAAVRSQASADSERMPVVPGQAGPRTTTYRTAASADIAAAEHRPGSKPRPADEPWFAPGTGPAGPGAPLVPAARQTPLDPPTETFNSRVVDRARPHFSQDDNPTMDVRFQRDRLREPKDDPLTGHENGYGNGHGNGNGNGHGNGNGYGNGYGDDLQPAIRPDASPSGDRFPQWNGYSPDSQVFPNGLDEDTTTIVSDEGVSVIKLDAVGPARATMSYSNGRGRDRNGRRDPQ